tara:strand:- start:854 stop:1195 length:342 start_codon:yes stop_codon:yes gene_type:complete
MIQYFSLRCKYFEDAPMILYPSEYVVTFKCLEPFTNSRPIINENPWPPEGEEWCIVQREDVKPQENNEGLVKIVIDADKVDFKNKTAVVGTYNSPDRKIDFFKVPMSEIPEND